MRCKQNFLIFYTVLFVLLTNALHTKRKQRCLKSLNLNEFCLNRKIRTCANKRPKGPLSLTWVQSTLQKFDYGMEPKTTTLHPTCFKITALHSVCCYNLLGWRSFWNVPPSLMDMLGRQFLFTFRPEKHKLGRGR